MHKQIKTIEIQNQSSATHKEMNQQVKPHQQWFIFFPFPAAQLMGFEISA